MCVMDTPLSFHQPLHLYKLQQVKLDLFSSANFPDAKQPSISVVSGFSR